MKKKLILLLCIMIAATAFLAACSKKNDKTNDLTANDLVGMIGISYEKMKKGIGELEEDADEIRRSAYSYTRRVFGADSTISVNMDDQGKNVDRMIVYTDKNNLDRWRDELRLKYGVGANDTWQDNSVKIRIVDSGDQGVVYIDNNRK